MVQEVNRRLPRLQHEVDTARFVVQVQRAETAVLTQNACTRRCATRIHSTLSYSQKLLCTGRLCLALLLSVGCLKLTNSSA